MSAADTISFEILGETVTLAYLPHNGFVIREIFQDRCYAPIDFVQGVSSLLDIGANIGASTVFFKFTYPQAQIHAFEPGRGAFDLLVQNTEPYGQITAHNVGLWSEDKTAELFVGDHDYATASLANPNGDNQSTDNITLKACAAYLKSLAVEHVDIAKIDTEGCEVPILVDLVANYDMRVVYVEFHSEEDRWRIEDIMRPAYSLFSASIQNLHRGTICYVRRQTIDEDSEYHRHRITVGA